MPSPRGPFAGSPAEVALGVWVWADAWPVSAQAAANANRAASCGALRNRRHGQVRAGGNVPIQAADLKLTPCLPGVAARARAYHYR